MTKDELRKHCERMCARYAEANRVTTCLTYEEHKLVLDLLDTDDVLTKALVIQALEDVRAEIEARTKNYRKEHSEIIWDTADITNGIFEQTSYGQGLGLKEALEIIDRKIKEIENDQVKV